MAQQSVKRTDDGVPLPEGLSRSLEQSAQDIRIGRTTDARQALDRWRAKIDRHLTGQRD